MMMGMMFLWPVFLLLFLALPVVVGVGACLMYRNVKASGDLAPVLIAVHVEDLHSDT